MATRFERKMQVKQAISSNSATTAMEPISTHGTPSLTLPSTGVLKTPAGAVVFLPFVVRDAPPTVVLLERKEPVVGAIVVAVSLVSDRLVVELPCDFVS